MIPIFRTAYLEIISLGVRDLKPYNIQAVSNPYVSFEMITGKGRLSFSTAPSKVRNNKYTTQPNESMNSADDESLLCVPVVHHSAILLPLYSFIFTIIHSMRFARPQGPRMHFFWKEL